MGYLSYWSLNSRPFAQQDIFYAGSPQREAIAGLSYFVASQNDSAFLVAPRGCGTTRLLNYVTQMNGFGDCAAEAIVTDGVYLHRECVHDALSEALGYRHAAGDVKDRIRRAMQIGQEQGVQTVWLIDRCESAAAHAARDLVADFANLSAVIATSPRDFGTRVAEFGRCGMRVDLAPLSMDETIQYLRSCLEHAGGSSQLVPDNAAIRLHELTGGVLADLSVMAESALVVAARHEMEEVSPAAIEAAGEQTARAA